VVALFTAIIAALRSAVRPRASLVAENLALRQPLAVLRRKTKRPQLVPLDRAFWVVLSRVWSRWAETLTIVKPETVISWHQDSLGSGPGNRSASADRRSRPRSWN
jgi:hypothetical protein